MNKDLLHSKVELFETGGEISYQGDANVAKFLLGGIGTGNIAVGARIFIIAMPFSSTKSTFPIYIARGCMC